MFNAIRDKINMFNAIRDKINMFNAIRDKMNMFNAIRDKMNMFNAVFRRTWTDTEELLKEKSFFILSFVFLSEFVIRQVQTNIF